MNGWPFGTISRPFRAWARLHLDRAFCRPIAGLRTFGTESVWTVEDKLNSASIVYSGGVGWDISFEKELVRRFGVAVDLFDPSPTGQATMAKEGPLPGIHYHPVGLAGISGRRGFSSPEDSREGSYRIATERLSDYFECISIPEWMHRRGHDKLDLLKLDVEGFEYEILENILGSGISIQQICVEFHPWLVRFGRLRLAKLLLKLRRAGYRLVHKCRGDYTFVLF